MIDFLIFKHMVTPLIIQLLFWLGIIAVELVGLATIGISLTSGGGSSRPTGLGPMGGSAAGPVGVLLGLALMLLGPLVVRIYAEMLIVIFRINETLTEVANLLKEMRNSQYQHPQV